MASRLKLVVAYDGTTFDGWQSQRSKNAVQDHLERAFGVIIGNRVPVHGAGRTDAGVHALAQTAHADLPSRSVTEEQWPAALNASLPPTIRVIVCRYVPVTFHARFSAKGKLYRYRIWNDRILPPFEVGRAWHVATPLNAEEMAKEAEAFRGRHDFRSFAANRGQKEGDTVRTIDAVKVRQKGRCITIEVSGDGFLYKMVRLMVGALVQRGRGQVAAGAVKKRLERPAQGLDKARLVADAQGLFLIRVRY